MDIGGAESGPYVGQRAFEAADREIFFGRDAERDELRDLLERHRTVVLHGAAGSGKTSLVRAGLALALPDDAEVLTSGRLVTGSPFPQAVLPDHNPYTAAVLSAWRPAESPTRLAQLSLAEFLADRADYSGWSAVPIKVFAIIDQLEDVFGDWRQSTYQREFFTDIADAMRTVPALRVLLSVRTENLAQLRPYEELLGLTPDSYCYLQPLSREPALQAVLEPMAQAGFPLGRESAELLVEELARSVGGGLPGEPARGRDGYVEPAQLQALCIDLYLELQAGRELTTDATAMRRTVDRSLARLSGHIIREVAAEHGVGSRAVAGWLRETFITPAGARASVSEQARSLTGVQLSVIAGLLNRHLVKAYLDSGVRHYSLANDRLIPAVRKADSAMSRDRGRATDALGSLRAATAALVAGKFDVAQRHAERARDAANEDLGLRADAHSVLGNIAYQRGRMDVAESHYMEAAQLREQMQDQPSVGRLLGAIGRIHAIGGRYTAAVAELQSAVTRLPADLTLHTELAKALWNAGQSQAAAAVFGSVLTIEPASAEALAGRAQISAESGDASSALHDLRTLHRLRPTAGLKPEVRSAYALALARTGSAAIAMAEADAALASAPENGVIVLRAARVAREARAPERATELLHRAVTATDPALSADQLGEVRSLLASLTQAGALS
jgi:tetratricopeptide (TPR) repeat protein